MIKKKYLPFNYFLFKMSEDKTFSSFEEVVKDVVKRLYMYDNNILDDIFKNPTLTNIFLKTDNLKQFLFDYVITTKSKRFYELVEYFKNDFIERYNSFKFYNGQFTQIDLNQLPKTNEGEEFLNTILIFNTKKTTNKEFNYIFDKIKQLEIRSFKFDETFNDILLNNIRNNYKFNFMDIYQHKDVNISAPTNFNFPDVKYKYLDLMDNYILKFNDDSMLFKKWFYILLSYVYDKKDLSFNDLLNIFFNFNILFYHKLISQNKRDDCLITYIYFKMNSEEYKPNLRYTTEIPFDNHNDKIRYLKSISNKPRNFKEFKTEIINDDKGIYFKTCEYKPEEINKRCQDYINLKKYDSLIYYIFNSQFLNRSTCLFGYFIYFYFTHQILRNKYFDIIALTQDFIKFKEYLNNDNVVLVKEFEKIDNINLDYIIDIIN